MRWLLRNSARIGAVVLVFGAVVYAGQQRRHDNARVLRRQVRATAQQVQDILRFNPYRPER